MQCFGKMQESVGFMLKY